MRSFLNNVSITQLLTTSWLSAFFNWASENNIVWWLTLFITAISLLLIIRKATLIICMDYQKFKENRLFKPDKNKNRENENMS